MTATRSPPLAISTSCARSAAVSGVATPDHPRVSVRVGGRGLLKSFVGLGLGHEIASQWGEWDQKSTAAALITAPLANEFSLLRFL